MNYASIGRAGGTAQVTIDSPSIFKYGPQTMKRTDWLNETDDWPAEFSAQVVAARKAPKERVVSVKLTDGDADAVAAVLDAGLGTPIRIRRYSGPWEFDMNALIQGAKHSIMPDRWTVEYATDDSYDTTTRSG